MQKNINGVADNQNGNNSLTFVKPEPLDVPDDCTPTDEAFAAVVDDLINDIILDFCFQLHPASKIGLVQAEEDEKVLQETEDIFGLVRSKQKHEQICCPYCYKKMDPTRFANHVENNCSMGNGRQSGRNAHKRNNVDYKMGGDSCCDDDDDDENQSDVSYGSSGRKKNARKKNTNKNPRKKFSRDGFDYASSPQSPTDIKKHLALHCGVISKFTKKMCQKTMNCSQHSLLQKNAVRAQHNVNLIIDQSQIKTEDVPIDVDTVDEEINGMNSESSTPEGNEYSE